MSDVRVLGPIGEGHGGVVNVTFFVFGLEIEHQVAV
mgnify:CR=1 FL=1